MAPTNIKPSVTILPAAVATGLSLRYTPPKGGGGGVQYQDGLDPKYQPYVDLALEAIYEGLGIEKPKATETSGVTVVNYQIERAADQGDEELGGEDESEGTEEDG